MIQTSAVTLEVGRAGCSAHRPSSGHRGHPSHSGSGGDRHVLGTRRLGRLGRETGGGNVAVPGFFETGHF